MKVLEPDESAVFQLFDANEPDPHRVRFWQVRVEPDGLTLQLVFEPDAEKATARWHEVFDLLVARPALLEDRDEVEQELRSLRDEVQNERRRLARLHAVLDARHAQLAALEASGAIAEQRGVAGSLRLLRDTEGAS
jgi:hypothetical protein